MNSQIENLQYISKFVFPCRNELKKLLNQLTVTNLWGIILLTYIPDGSTSLL